MTTSSYSDAFVAAPVDIRDRMAESIADVLRDTARGEVDRIHRIAMTIDALDPLAWLSRQKPKSRFFWRSRGGEYTCAGIGIAHEIISSTSDDGCVNRIMASIDQADPDVRYVGGMRFAPGADGDPLWSKFHCAHFVLPRFEISCNGDKTTFACHLRERDNASDILELLAGIIFDDSCTLTSLPTPTLRYDTPDREKWAGMVDDAMRELHAGELEKIVLARRADITFDVDLDPVGVLLRLRAVTPQCYHFCFQSDSDVSFIGASPERLYYRHGRHLESEAVAGTRPRGDTPDSDAKLSKALLSSDKDLREHGYVNDMILDVLHPICSELTVDSKVTLLKLARGQHLFTGYAGRLAESVSDSDLCSRLHPTPAVGGCPTNKAIVRIRELEGFDRGWYAAPFGSIGRNVVELAVAIRSALVEKRRLSLFSGAGIVIGSTPEQEWEEIENKIADFIKILTMSS